MVTNIKRPVQHCIAHSAENIAIVSENITEYPNRNIPRRFEELWLSYGTLGGYFNEQNCHIWDSEHPQVIEERPLHQEKGPCLVRSLNRSCDWTLLLRKQQWNNCHHQFGALWSYHKRLFFACYWRILLGEYVVSTRQCHMLHNSCA